MRVVLDLNENAELVFMELRQRRLGSGCRYAVGTQAAETLLAFGAIGIADVQTVNGQVVGSILSKNSAPVGGFF